MIIGHWSVHAAERRIKIRKEPGRCISISQQFTSMGPTFKLNVHVGSSASYGLPGMAGQGKFL